MAKNKNKKPQPPSDQERTYDRAEGFGRGGRGQGRGRGGRGGRGGGASDGGGESGSSHGQSGSRGGGPSNLRGGPPPFVSGYESGRGRGGRGRGFWVGRGRGFRGADFGGFTGNSRGGKPLYHSMDEVDFEIQQWGEPTKRLVTLIFLLSIDFHRTSQTNHRKAGGTPLVVGVEDRLQNPAGTIPLEDVGVAVVVEVSLRNFHLLRRCRNFGTKKGRCCGP